MTTAAATATARGTFLETLLRELGESPGALAVFDVDDTLLSTAGRHLRILSEYAEHPAVGLRFPAAGVLRGMTEERLRYLIADTAREAGLAEAALLEDLKAFWFARFFRDDYLRFDRPVPGAPAFCRAAASRGARLVYLTGRDESMRRGTEGALCAHGFPGEAEGAVLLMKPRFELPDREFKAEALARIAAMGEVAAGFENEPALANLLLERFSEARVALLETRHSGAPASLLPGIVRIPDFLP